MGMKTFGQIRESLDIPREKMPQLPDIEDFIAWVKNQGIIVQYLLLNPKNLINAQQDINPDKVAKIKRIPELKPIIIARDNYILDGNHRNEAAKEQLHQIPVYMVNLNFPDLLSLAKKYPKVFFKEGLNDYFFGGVADYPPENKSGVDDKPPPKRKIKTEGTSLGIGTGTYYQTTTDLEADHPINMNSGKKAKSMKNPLKEENLIIKITKNGEVKNVSPVQWLALKKQGWKKVTVKTVDPADTRPKKKNPNLQQEEPLNEISKKTLGSYIKKASRDASMHRELSGSVYRRATDRAKHGKHDVAAVLDRDAEKYENKAERRFKGIEKATNRLTKEEPAFSKIDDHEAKANAAQHKKKSGKLTEQPINELSKKTLGSYAKKAVNDVSFHSYMSGAKVQAADKNDPPLHDDRKAFKRQQGVERAVGKLSQEDMDLSTQAAGGALNTPYYGSYPREKYQNVKEEINHLVETKLLEKKKEVEEDTVGPEINAKMYGGVNASGGIGGAYSIPQEGKKSFAKIKESLRNKYIREDSDTEGDDKDESPPPTGYSKQKSKEDSVSSDSVSEGKKGK